MKMVSEISVVAVMLFIPSLAQSVEGDSSAGVTTLYIPTAEYRGMHTGAGVDAVFENMIPSPELAGREPSRIKIYRAEGLSMANTGSNMLLRDDSFYFTTKAMTSNVNGILSFISTARQSKLDDSTTRWIQVLSLLATREINTELAYSVPLSRSSSIDSNISCNLRIVSGTGAADMAAHIRYNFKF